MQRLDREAKRQVQQAFEERYKDDPNLNEVCMRYNVWDGDWIQVKVRDIWASDFPEIFNGHNVFVEEAPPIRRPLPQD